MTRAVPEWIADHDDQAIPKRVKARIWLRDQGRCYLSGAKIRPGDAYEFEHRLALECGGEHRESNIFLALSEAHKPKTAKDHADGAKIKRIHAKHNGYWPESKTKLKGRGFETSRKAPTHNRAEKGGRASWPGANKRIPQVLKDTP